MRGYPGGRYRTLEKWMSLLSPSSSATTTYSWSVSGAATVPGCRYVMCELQYAHTRIPTSRARVPGGRTSRIYTKSQVKYLLSCVKNI